MEVAGIEPVGQCVIFNIYITIAPKVYHQNYLLQ